jgi:hypothetical protein
MEVMLWEKRKRKTGERAEEALISSERLVDTHSPPLHVAQARLVPGIPC